MARRIEAITESGGHTVDVLPVGSIASLINYDTVVLGSAIHNQAWLAEAAGFAQTHAVDLAARPVWLFSVGMSAARSWHHTTRMGRTTTSLELQRCASGTASGKSARTSMTGTLSGPATTSFLRIIRSPAGHHLCFQLRMNIRSASTRGPAAET